MAESALFNCFSRPDLCAAGRRPVQARGELQQHKPFSHKTSQILIHVRCQGLPGWWGRGAAAPAPAGAAWLLRWVQRGCLRMFWQLAELLVAPPAELLVSNRWLSSNATPHVGCVPRAASPQRGCTGGGTEGAQARQASSASQPASGAVAGPHTRAVGWMPALPQCMPAPAAHSPRAPGHWRADPCC